MDAFAGGIMLALGVAVVAGVILLPIALPLVILTQTGAITLPTV